MYSLKRRREDDEQEDQKSKKPKEDKKAETIGRRLESAAEQLKEYLEHLKTKSNQDELARNTMPEAIEDLLVACNAILRNPANAPEGLARWFNEPLRPESISDAQGTPTSNSKLESWLGLVETSIQEVSTHLNELYRARNAPPSASTYAKPSHWHYWQDQTTAILNLRPRKNQGLPLCVLFLQPLFQIMIIIVLMTLVFLSSTKLPMHYARLCLKNSKPNLTGPFVFSVMSNP